MKKEGNKYKALGGCNLTRPLHMKACRQNASKELGAQSEVH